MYSKTRLQEKTIRRIWVAILIIISVVRIGFFVRIPYYAIGESYFDDHYLLNLAESLINGEWLGIYSISTLTKGISFPLFVAVAYKLGMSYSVALAVIYILSAAVFCLAISKLTDNRIILGLVYVLLIFSPTGFAYDITQRLYRNSLVFPSVLLVIGCILMVYYYRGSKPFKQMIWLVLLGFSFSFFYYNREDSIWFVPFFICSLVIIAVWYLLFYGKKDWKKRTGRIALLLIPAIIFSVVTFEYKNTNKNYYGVFETNDRSDSNFATLTGNMIRIKDEAGVSSDFWISKKKMEKIVENCPSLVADKDIYMDLYDRWAEDGDDGNVKGDLSVWIFRIALSTLGYYQDAKTANDFCGQVNDELLAAVDQGNLEFDNAIHFTSQCRGIYWKELGGFAADTVKNIWNVVTFKDAEARLEESSGDAESISFMENITGVSTISNVNNTLNVVGWIVLKNSSENTVIKLEDADGNIITTVDRYERSDVAEAFPEYPEAAMSGFSLQLDEEENFEDDYFVIYENGEATDRIQTVNQQDDKVILNIEEAQIDIDSEEFYNTRIIDISNTCINIERILSIILFPVSLVAFIILMVLFIRKRTWENFEMVIIPFGILLSLCLLEFGVTVFNSWLDSIWFYSTGVIPLAQSFEVLTILYLIRLKNHQKTKVTRASLSSDLDMEDEAM